MRRLTFFSAGFASACLLSFFWTDARLLLPFFLFVSLCLWKWRTYWRRVRCVVLGVCLGLLWFMLCALWNPASTLVNRTVELEAVALDWPSETPYGYSVLVRAGEKEGRTVRGLLYLDEEGAGVRPGDGISCIAHCTSSRILHAEDSVYYTSKGIELFFHSYGTVHRTSQAENWRVLPALAAGKLRELIDALYPREEHATLLHALLLGRKSGLSTTLQHCFNRVGVSHVLVVSGLHVSFLAGLLSVFLRSNRRSTALITIAVLGFFAAMTGGAPGSVRAAILCSAGLLAPLFGRRNDPATSLSAALLFLLLCHPNAIANAGLQFSFAATAGIYCFGQPLYRHWQALLPKHLKRWIAPPLSVLAISLGALVFTLPLSALYFGSISLVAPLTNLCTAWAVSAAFLGGVVSLCVGFISLPLGQIIALLVGIPLDFFVGCSRLFNRLTFANLPLHSVYYQAWLFFLCAVSLLCLLWRKEKQRAIAPVCCCIITLCVSILFTGISARQDQIRLDVLDVGQGQSVALYAGGYTVLVDCGGAPDAGSVAADALQSVGTSHLTLLVLTHYHADHANGVAELMGRLPVDAIALPDTDPEDALRQEIEALAQTQGTQLYYIREPTEVDFGKARLTLYEPQGTSEQNEQGLSVLCTSGTWDALLTGDMDAETETQLLRQHPLPDLELLVAGHHGSRFATGDALLEETKPDCVVISVGYNTYGHPNERLLERLAERNIPVYRTDQMGTVTVRGRGA